MPREHRILITGASGFVGSWLRREFENRRRQENCDLTVLTTAHGSGEGGTIDISDKDQVLALIRRSRPSAIIHLAAIAAPADARMMPRRAWDVNFQGTMNLAYATLEYAPEARFISIGSSEAYGASFIRAASAPVKEQTALMPMNVYGATKAAADILIGQLAYEGLRSIRFRPFNHTGPGQTDVYVASAFARQLAEISCGIKPPVIMVGNLNASRDFLDVQDVVRAYADAALFDIDSAIFGEVYNLASGRPIVIKSILNTLVELSGMKVEIGIDSQRLRVSEIPVASGDSTAALKAFGWKPEVELRDTLSNVLNYWKDRIGSR